MSDEVREPSDNRDEPTSWPEDFFDPNRLAPEDLELLRSGGDRFWKEIRAARRSRKRDQLSEVFTSGNE
ncbi:MAG: hypothetical protein MI919_14530 [Holophagales bacterium]|nr:hypothetical protein [Holophagales bacterium]